MSRRPKAAVLLNGAMDSCTAAPEVQTRSAIGGNGIPFSYVPFRNAHFLAVAVSWAEVIGATAIFIGAVAEDSSGYPDCRPEYYRVFQQLVREGTCPRLKSKLSRRSWVCENGRS